MNRAERKVSAQQESLGLNDAVTSLLRSLLCGNWKLFFYFIAYCLPGTNKSVPSIKGLRINRYIPQIDQTQLFLG